MIESKSVLVGIFPISKEDEKMKTKGLISLAVASVFLLFGTLTVFAGGQSEQANGSVPRIVFTHNWTGGDSHAPYFEPLLNEFAKENKAKFNLVIQGYETTAYIDKIKVSLASGTLPDEMGYWAGPSYLAPLVKNHLIVSTDDMTAASNVIKRSDWNPADFKDFTIDGKSYGLPTEAIKGFFLVNKALFEKYNLKYPKNYADLQAVAKVFSSHGIVPIDVGSKGGNPGHFFIDLLAYQFPNGYSDAMSTETTYKFDTPSRLKAADLVAAMVKEHMFPADTVANGDWGPSVQLYSQSKAAMTYTFPWMIAAIDKSVRDTTDVIAFPTMPGATMPPTDFFLGGVSEGIQINQKSFSDPAKKSALVALMNFLESDKMYNSLAKADMFPTKNMTLDTTGLDPLYVKINNFTKTQPNLYEGIYTQMPTAQLGDIFFSTVDELFSGAMSGQQYVAKMQKAFDQAKSGN